MSRITDPLLDPIFHVDLSQTQESTENSSHLLLLLSFYICVFSNLVTWFLELVLRMGQGRFLFDGVDVKRTTPFCRLSLQEVIY